MSKARELYDEYKRNQGKSAAERLYGEWRQQNAVKIGNSIISDANNYIKNSNAYNQLFKERFGTEENYTYRADASDWYDEMQGKSDGLLQERNAVLARLQQNYDILDEKTYKTLHETLNGTGSAHQKLLEMAKNDADFMASFEDEDAWNAWNQDRLHTEHLENDFDIEAAKVERQRYLDAYTYQDRSLVDPDLNAPVQMKGNSEESIERLRQERLNNPAWQNSLEDLERDVERAEGSVGFLDLKEKADELGRDIALAERLQDRKMLEGIVDDPAFEELAQKGESVQANLTMPSGGWFGDFARDYSTVDIRALTENEEKIKNAWLGSGEPEKAQRYLDIITEDVNERQAETLSTDSIAGNIAYRALLGISNNVESLGYLFSDADYLPTSVGQHADQKAAKSLQDAGWLAQGAGDVASGLGGMAVSIGLSQIPYVGPALGIAEMGVSAAGQAYQSALNDGHGKGNARAYGLAVGASEAGLQYLLGGFGKLGSGVMSKLFGNVGEKIGNALFKTAGKKALFNSIGKVVGNMAGEGLEEYLQEVLDPVFRNAFLGEENAVELFSEEALYAGIIGALTSSVFEGVEVSVNRANTAGTGATLKKVGLSDALMAAGQAQDVESLAYELSGKEKISNYKLGRLFQEIESSPFKAERDAIRDALIEKNTLPKDAETLANAYVALASGHQLTKDQIVALAGNDVLQEVENELYQKDISFGKNLLAVKEARRALEAARNGKEFTLSPKLTQNGEAVTVKEAVSLKSASKKYGAQAGAMIHTYQQGQDVEKYDRAYQSAFGMGKDGVKLEYMMNSESTSYLTETQRQLAYEAGQAAASSVQKQDTDQTTQDTLSSSFDRLDIDPSYREAYVAGFSEEDFKGTDGKIADNAIVQYEAGFKEAVDFGKIGIEVKTEQEAAAEGKPLVDKSQFAHKLNRKAREAAYKIGAEIAEKETETSQNKRDTAVEKRKESGKGKAKKTGELHYAPQKINSNMKRAGVQLGKRLAALGVDVYLFESHQDAKGRFVDDNGNIADNGYYIAGDGSIHIDLNAGNNGQGLMLYTMAHELAHFMKDKSPREFKIFADLLVKWYGKKGVSVADLVYDRMTEEDLSWDDAYEEVVARSCEAFLTDSNITERLAELEKTDKTVSETIRNWLRRFANWVRSLYSEVDPESKEGQLLKKWSDEVQEIHDAFFNALSSAVETNQWLGDVSDGAVETEEDAKHAKRYSANNVAIRKKSYYNEFKSEAMQWAYKADRKSGDATIIYDEKRKKHILIEALEDGYFEVASGTYEEMRDFYEQTYRRATDEVYGNTESFESAEGADLWDMQLSEDGGNGGGNDSTLEGEGLSTDPAGNDEHLRSGDQGKSVKKSYRTKYSYDYFVSKPDMVITAVNEEVPDNRADIVAAAKKNAAKIGKVDPKTGSVSVYVDDVGAEILLGTDGLKHGLRRTKDPQGGANFRVTLKAGEIIKNSIRVNETIPRKPNATAAYILIGVAKDLSGNLYIVRSVVNRFNNELAEMDVLYAVNAKKELAAQNAPRSAAKPLSATSSTISISDLLDYVNRYFPDVLPEDVLRHFQYTKRPAGDMSKDVLYQRRGEMSNRSLLASALESATQNDIEHNRLQQYHAKIEEINAEEEKLQELRGKIKELSFAKGPRDTEKIARLQEEATRVSNRINTFDRQLLRLEATAPLKALLAREKAAVQKRADQRRRDMMEEYRKSTLETREKRDARAKLQKLVLDTARWLSRPSKTEIKCPDILKEPYAAFLDGIDMSSQRLANGGEPTQNDSHLANVMDTLAKTLDRIVSSQMPSEEDDGSTPSLLDAGYLDLPKNFVKELQDAAEKVKQMMVVGDYVINTMSAADVKQLSRLIRTLNHAIKEVSTLYTVMRYANVEDLGNGTVSFMDALGEMETSGGVRDFVQWQNALPYYAFKRFGDGGMAIFESLMDSQDKLAFLAQTIFDFREKTWTDEEAKEWSEDVHTIELSDGELTLTTADAMSIYCLSRREHAVPHLIGGGVRVVGLQKGSKKAKDSRSALTEEDVNKICASLGERQRIVAEAIQTFMSTVCAEWGNEISMKRFLTRDFNEKFYFPIESNDENLTQKDPAAQQSDLFRLLNISATKPLTEGANNEVIIRNIFDVFTNHTSDMARLNAYGMAVLDYMKWLNYRKKLSNDKGQHEVVGVRKSMQKAYGDAAGKYVLNLIKDINGRASDGGVPTFYAKMLRNAKTAMVGNSLRVATLQVTSYPRAALVLSPKSLALGLTKKPNIKKAKKYCGIALWKSFGFYDTNIARSMEDQIKGVKNIKQKLIEWSLKGAEWGDALTWGALWNACEYEVAQSTQNKVGSEAFYQEVGKKLRDVVYRTQVVDSTLTRSEMMRSKNAKAQELSAFMSEPTLSANILMDAGFEFNLEKRRSGSAKAAWKKTGKYVARSLAVYSAGQLAAAILEGAWDAYRDDEDEEFGEKFASAFSENLVLDLIPLNKIPIVSDLAEAALSMVGLGYFSADSLSSTALSQTVSAVDAWKEVFSGESSVTTYNAIYKTMRALSSFYGVSFSGVMREGVALWNNTAGAYDSTLKVLNYGRSKTELGHAYCEAIVKGDNRQAERLKTQFEDEKELASAVLTTLREMYTDGEIDKQTTLSLLEDYVAEKGDSDKEVREKAEKLVNKWSCVIVTGIKYEDIKEEYLKGNITEERAVQMRVLYGGYKREDARKLVRKWKAEAEEKNE